MAVGIADLERGRFRDHTDETIAALAVEISQHGRMRLDKLRQKAKHKK